MKRTMYLLAALLVVTAILAGCGPAATQAPAGAGEAKGPTFAVYADNSHPTTAWDPAIEFSNGIGLDNNIYEQLVRYDARNKKVLPWLAESYTVSDDGLVYTFKIRKGVKFQNGDPMTAEDVKYSIDRTMAIAAGASYIWSSVSNIEVVDPETVVFTQSYVAPLDLVASTGYAAMIYSKKCVGEDNVWIDEAKGCGTGPYMLKSNVLMDEVVIERFPDYWGGWGDKYIDTIDFKKVSEPATRRQMIESGEAAITSGLPAVDTDALRNNPNVEVHIEPSLQNLIAMFNTQKPPLDNVKVRQALAYAMPYDEIIKTAIGGYGQQSYGIVPYGLWGWSDTLPRYTYDLDKARELLKEAGYPDGGFKLLLTYMSGEEPEKVTAELYKSELAKLNIDLEIRSMQWDSQWELAKGAPETRQDIFVMYWWPDLPSPYSFMYSLFHTEEETLFGLAYYQNQEFDDLIDKANEITSTEPAKAEAMFIEAQKMLLDEAITMFLFDRQDQWITVKNLKGFKYNPAYPMTMNYHDMYFE